MLRTSGKHTIFLNYLYYVSNTGFEEVWFSDMDDQIGVLTRHIDTKGVLGIDKVFPARFLIPLQERCPELKTVWGSDCVAIQSLQSGDIKACLLSDRFAKKFVENRGLRFHSVH